jgi:hypothetical protein
MGVISMKKISGIAVVAILFFCLAPCNPVYAQIKVCVDAQADDNDVTGENLIFKIKETIRSSENMQLVSDESDAQFQIKVLTLDPEKKGGYTIYSIVWTAKLLNGANAFLNHTIGICSSDRIDLIAVNLVAKTDKIISDAQKIIKEKQLKVFPSYNKKQG